jgi:putative effector of murein hydrolase LrgA (UPF0299 family)
MAIVIVGLLWLLGCQLVGEVLVRLTGVPIPGPVVGMVLLLVLLRWRRLQDGAPVVRAGDFLLSHLQLFFVPAGAGVVVYLGVLRQHALPIALGLLGSWLLALAAVGWTVTLLTRGRAYASGATPEEIE